MEAVSKTKSCEFCLEEVLEENLLLRRVLERSGIGFWSGDLPLDRLNLDNQASKLFFISPREEISVDLLWNRLHPDDLESTRLAMERAVWGRTMFESEYRAVNPGSGEVRWLRSLGQAAYASDGTPVRFGGISYDISDFKRVEEALRVSEEKFSRAFRLNTSAMAITRLSDGFFIDVNDRWCELTGFPRIEAVGKTCPELKLWKNPEERARAARELERRGSICNREYTFVKKSGKEWIGLFSSQISMLSEEKVLITSLIDVTGRKRNEENLLKIRTELEQRVLERTSELKAASLYARSLIEVSPDPLVTISMEGKITDVNQASERATGFSRTDLIGKDFSEFFTEPERARAGYESVFRKGIVRDYPLQLKHRKGQIMPVLYNASVYRDEQGRIKGVFAAARDITRLKRAEEALQRAYGELEQKVEERTRELMQSEAKLRKAHSDLKKVMNRLEDIREEERTAIARELHDELGQVLAGFRMDLSWLLKRLPPDRIELIRKTEFMKGYIDPAIELIRRISSELRPGILDDLGLVATVEWQLQVLRNRTGMECEFDSHIDESGLDGKLKTVLFRIVQESITNIIRHSGATLLRINLVQYDGHLNLTVADNGKGISPQDLRKKSSTGIRGMRERLAAYDGEVNIRGKRGEGTVIDITIPFKNR
ncbi:MAG: PAS domain S-box protein [Syntrophales bacterium]|nr:PAS domain S-box protein [Syntrophales bacterium]MDD5532650.1 PAS domain S-box protein [Syntrophales bacterium]